MYLYDRNMMATPNYKYANSSSNYYVIMILQRKIKFQNRKFPIFSHFRGTKCRFEANNNRFAVVVCARHVVKRPSKRSALVTNKFHYKAMTQARVLQIVKEAIY